MNRISYFDNLKFTLISLVVIGHFADPFIKVFPKYSMVFFFIYLFHMPLFVFVTGVFSKSVIKKNQNDLHPTKNGKIEKSYNYLKVIQFALLYLILNYSIYAIEFFLNGKDVVFNPIQVSNATWYLLACCIWYLLITLLDGRKPFIVIPISIIIALAIGYFSFINDYFALSRVICFTPFFFAGYYISIETINHKFTNIKKLTRVIAGIILICSFIVVFLAYQNTNYISEFRGILTARNSYNILDSIAWAGAIVRAAWYIVATILGICLMLIVPSKKLFFTGLGKNTLQLYIWHLVVLRLLGCISFVSIIEGIADEHWIAKIIPMLTAILVIIIFSLKPPFGLIIDLILRGKKYMKLTTSLKITISLIIFLIVASAVVFGAAAIKDKKMEEKPKSAPVNEQTKQATTESAISETSEPKVAEEIDLNKPLYEDAKFEIPIEDSMGFAVVNTDIKEKAEKSSKSAGKIPPGGAFTIIEEDSTGKWWKIERESITGYVENDRCMINLPDIIPSIIYDDTNAYASIMVSSGYDIPEITGKKLYDAKSFNEKLGKDQYVMPVMYPVANKIYNAQQKALENDETLIIYEAFRPADVQKKIVKQVTALANNNAEVRNGIASGGWSKSWFISTGVSNHQKGIAIDVSLGEVNKKALFENGKYDYIYLESYLEHEMPTRMHELSKKSITFVSPYPVNNTKGWEKQKLAPSFNDNAKRLQKYCTEAGFTPLSSEWWHFNDHETRVKVPSGSAGKYRLEIEVP